MPRGAADLRMDILSDRKFHASRTNFVIGDGHINNQKAGTKTAADETQLCEGRTGVEIFEIVLCSLYLIR